MADFGYDVADYCDIDPIFGTLRDFDSLLAECHRRGLRVILDFVPNHTSDQHPWFLESRSSLENPKRDWYLWRDQPNNWLSNFGGSAWEFDGTTGQYYYHSFLKQQPDLNWRNPAVRAAMFDVAAVLAAARRGWFSCRRDVADHQGRSVPRQSSQSRLSPWTTIQSSAPAGVQLRSPGGARARRRDARGHRWISRARA